MIEREPVSPWPPSPSIADFTVPIRIRWWPPDCHYLPRVKLKHRYITYRKSRQFNPLYRSKLRDRRKHPNQQIRHNHQLNKKINKFLVNRIKYFYLNKRTLRHCLLRSFGLSMRFAHNKIAKVVATRDWLAVDTKSVINWDCNCHR